MKLFLVFLLFAATNFELSSATFFQDHTSIEPGDYTFNGKVVCAIEGRPEIREDAYVRLMEADPITLDDEVATARIHLDGSFTLKTFKGMTDPPTPKWELYLEFHCPCYFKEDMLHTDGPWAKWSSYFVKPDEAHNGYFVTYTMKTGWFQNSVDVSA